MLELTKENEIKKELERITKITKTVSFIRFCLFLLIVVFVVCLITLDQFALYLTLSLIYIALFMGCILFTNPFYHRLKVLHNLEYIYKKHENRRNYSYHSFTPDGRDLLDYSDYKELDLDLLGPRSLFQYLCVAKSKEGKAKLAKQLCRPEEKSDDFRACVASLAASESSLELEASISLIGADAKDCDQSEMLALADKRIHFSWLAIGLAVLSYVAFIALLVVFVLQKMNLYYLF
ncbi:MAG: hypothetical protein K2O22_04410, partial [Anaeroplasmataceae bacterium]|nr:hypothetical protein [Anaeroplasmataceae bacterium]